MSGKAYLDCVVRLLGEVKNTQLGMVREIGEMVGRSVAADGVAHVFGCGHSHLVAEEVFVRSGTLTTVRALWPDQLTDKFERVEGLGAAVLAMGDIRPGELLFIVSHSGINPLPIDVAVEAQRRGIVTVGVGSRGHSLAVPPRHSSGRRLLDVCSRYLDTCVPTGDAVLEIPGLAHPIGPASTVAAVALLQAVMVEAVRWLLEHGYVPPVRISRNLPGGDNHNRVLTERYRQRIPELAY